MKKSVIIILSVLGICLLAVVLYANVFVPLKLAKEEQEDKAQILEWVEKYGYAHLSRLADEPWYDEFMQEVLPTLTDKQFCSTILEMVEEYYDVRRLISDQEVAARLVPYLLDPDCDYMDYREGAGDWSVFTLFNVFDIWGYHNSYLLKGIQEGLVWDGESLSDLYQMSKDYDYSILRYGETGDYYKFYISCDEDALMEQINKHKQPFYKEPGLGGYYDRFDDRRAQYCGDFKVTGTSHWVTTSDYHVHQTHSSQMYFKDAHLVHITMETAKYYADGYLIGVDEDGNVAIANIDHRGDSKDIMDNDGIKLR